MADCTDCAKRAFSVANPAEAAGWGPEVEAGGDDWLDDPAAEVTDVLT